MIEPLHWLTLHFLATILSHGVRKNKGLLLDQLLKLNITHLLMSLQKHWLLALLHELGFPLKMPPSLLCDNLGATHLSFNLVHHSRMKRIQNDLHFVRDQVQKGTLQARHVHIYDQLADLLSHYPGNAKLNLLMEVRFCRGILRQVQEIYRCKNNLLQRLERNLHVICSHN